MKCPHPVTGMNPLRNRLTFYECRRRTCVACGWKYWLPHQKSKFDAGAPSDLTRLQLLTLTPVAQPQENWNVEGVGKAWNRFRSALKRRSPAFEYVRISEVQQRGFVHLHLVVRDLSVQVETLGQIAVRVGFGKKLDLRPVDDLAGIWTYLKKDLLKPNSVFRARRVINFSRGWRDVSQQPTRQPQEPFSKLEFDFAKHVVTWRDGEELRSLPESEIEPLIREAWERWRHMG